LVDAFRLKDLVNRLGVEPSRILLVNRGNQQFIHIPDSPVSLGTRHSPTSTFTGRLYSTSTYRSAGRRRVSSRKVDWDGSESLRREVSRFKATFLPQRLIREDEEPPKLSPEEERLLAHNGANLFSGTSLGFQRSRMPQIQTEPFLAHLKDNGIAFRDSNVMPSDLRPMQRHIHPPKVRQMVHAIRNGSFDRKKLEGFVTSNDGFVLDGLHRFAAKLIVEPEVRVRIVKVDLDARELRREAMRFEGSITKALRESERAKLAGSVLDEAKKKVKGNLCVNTGQGSGGGFTSCGATFPDGKPIPISKKRKRFIIAVFHDKWSVQGSSATARSAEKLVSRLRSRGREVAVIDTLDASIREAVDEARKKR